MISIEDYKKKLGKKAETKSDAEILKIMELQEKLADIFFDIWIDKINTKTEENKMLRLSHKYDTK